MPTVKTIKPLGGGDFTTLAAWQTFAAAQATADQWAECYSGGNLGRVTLAAWVSTPSALAYPRIYAEPGSRHDGRITGASGTNGAYISTTSTTCISTSTVPFLEVDGLILNCETGSTTGVVLNQPDYLFRNNLVRRNSGPARLLFTGTGKPVVQNVVYNNIFYFDPAVTGASGIALIIGNGDGSGGRGVFANNTILNNRKLTTGVQVQYLYGVNNESWIINNFAYGFDFASNIVSFFDTQDAGSYETSSFWQQNTDDDGQAIAYEVNSGLGTGNTQATGALTTYVTSATDPHPLPGTILIDTALDMNADTTFSFPSQDAVGTARPFALWDRGAIEYVAATTGGGRHRRRMTELYL